MKFTKALIPAFILLTLLNACSKEDVSPESKLLVGKWSWKRTSGGLTAHINETPASTGVQVLLEITTGNRYAIYNNDTLRSSGTYSLTDGMCIHNQGHKKILDFSDPSQADPMIERLGNDSLEFADEMHDGLGSLYTRK